MIEGFVLAGIIIAITYILVFKFDLNYETTLGLLMFIMFIMVVGLVVYYASTSVFTLKSLYGIIIINGIICLPLGSWLVYRGLEGSEQ